MADVLAVSDESFEREVLAERHAGPGRFLGALVRALPRHRARSSKSCRASTTGKLKVVKMNVDDNPRTPSQYGVRGIPNLLLIQGGQVKEQLVGALPKAKLVSAIWRTSSSRRRASGRTGARRHRNENSRASTTFITSPIPISRQTASTTRRS